MVGMNMKGIKQVNITESLLGSISNHFKKDKRTNQELKSMLCDLFESNNAEFKKMKKIYGNQSGINRDTFGLMQYEHYELEKLKKSMYGDDYEIERFMYEK